jgi:hypothetical protein
MQGKRTWSGVPIINPVRRLTGFMRVQQGGQLLNERCPDPQAGTVGLRGVILDARGHHAPGPLTGRDLLTPQGSKLLGQYHSQVAYGQRRVLLVWTRLIMPNGASVILDRLPGVDGQGYAGLEDKVDWRWDRIFAGPALTTLLGASAELVAPNNQSTQRGTVIIAARQSLQDTVNQVGQEMTSRNLDIQPR